FLTSQRQVHYPVLRASRPGTRRWVPADISSRDSYISSRCSAPGRPEDSGEPLRCPLLRSRVPQRGRSTAERWNEIEKTFPALLSTLEGSLGNPPSRRLSGSRWKG